MDIEEALDLLESVVIRPEPKPILFTLFYDPNIPLKDQIWPKHNS
jgi:hypothetical protein